MSPISDLDAAQMAFLEPYLPSDTVPTARDSKLPFVTLTYACSLDGLISLSPGVRTTLSGMETKSMTHYLRLKHDAILVGAGTAVADDPWLNCRYPHTTLNDQPRPLVVDPNLRWSASNASVTILSRTAEGKKPWIIHRSGVQHHAQSQSVTLLAVDADEEGLLDWQSILVLLKQKGIGSVLIEGGATILNSLLMQPDLVNSVIVTIAPTWLGEGGVHVSPAAHIVNGSRTNSARLSDTIWKQFGEDAVLCGRLNQPA